MKWWVWAGLATAVLATAWATAQWHETRDHRDLAWRVERTVSMPPGGATPCAAQGARPLVLLVLGQSNAGNHGAENEPRPDSGGGLVKVFADGRCALLADPLPGGTGAHQSIWSRLPAALARQQSGLEPLVALLAVDATRIADWTQDGSPLRARLRELLDALRQSGLAPDLVLWQQGEADAREGTPTVAYEAGLERLRTQLRAGRVNAPILMARSTVCRRGDGQAVRAAIARLAARHPDVREGPDTDALTGTDRVNGCHFSRAGLDRAAELWAQAIVSIHGGRRGP